MIASQPTPTRTYEMLIGGEWRPAAGGEAFERENPATGEPIGRFPRGDARDADAAVAAALRVHRDRTWRDLPGQEKQKLLRGVADWLRARLPELTKFVAAEAGKPRVWAEFDVIFAADYFDYYSGLVRDVGGRTIPNLRPDLFAYTVKEPAGVAAIMTPWNFPLLIASQKAAPALAAGCPVVLKPAPQTPLTALELARAFEELEAPPGLFNVVTDAGPGSPVGEALVAHPDIAAISFTGSSATAMRVMAAAAGTLKKVALECGGKSPNIVHRDADIEGAVDAAVFGVFFNTGQVCNAATRLFLHEDIADAFMERFVDKARALRVGPPSDPETQVGPLISREQFERVASYVEIGREEGAELVLGGEPLDGERLGHGYYFAPTIFDNVDQSMRISQEEIFGPVLASSRYDDLDRAIDDANATLYGLAGAVWTRDLDVADRVARRLDVGMVWVNEFLAMFPEVPHGGYKLSGIGREMGPEALHEFQQNKTIIQKTGSRQFLF